MTVPPASFIKSIASCCVGTCPLRSLIVPPSPTFFTFPFHVLSPRHPFPPTPFLLPVSLSPLALTHPPYNFYTFFSVPLEKAVNQSLCFFWFYLSTNCSYLTALIAPAPGIPYGFSASHTRYSLNVSQYRSAPAVYSSLLPPSADNTPGIPYF